MLGVDFISCKENINTLTTAGKLLFTMISAFAEFEREIISERVRAVMDKAKVKGKLIGRPKIPMYKITMVLEMTAKVLIIKRLLKS